MTLNASPMGVNQGYLGAGAEVGSGSRSRSGERHFQKLIVCERIRSKFLYNIYFYMFLCIYVNKSVKTVKTGVKIVKEILY